MTEIINKLNIKYKPWKVSAKKGNRKIIHAEITAEAAQKRQELLTKEGWDDIKIIEGKEFEQEEVSES